MYTKTTGQGVQDKGESESCEFRDRGERDKTDKSEMFKGKQIDK